MGSWWSGSSVMVCAVFGTSDDVLTLLPLSLSGRSAGRGWGGRGEGDPRKSSPQLLLSGNVLTVSPRGGPLVESRSPQADNQD